MAYRLGVHRTHDSFGYVYIEIFNTGMITPIEYFTNAYVEGLFNYEHVRTLPKRLNTFLYTKIEELFNRKIYFYKDS